MMKNKRAQQSSIMSHVMIAALIIGVAGSIVIMILVIRGGGAIESFVPAYARDITSVMENTVSSSADLDMVYEFAAPISVDFVNEKISLSLKKTTVTNRVYIPDDVEVTVLDSQKDTKFLLIKKVGKQLLLVPLGTLEDVEEYRRVSDVIADCGKVDYKLAVKTDVSELRNLPTKYPASQNSISVKITEPTYKTDARAIIVFYSESTPENLICQLQEKVLIEFDQRPIFYQTDHDQILDGNSVVFSFTNFPLVEAKVSSFLDSLVEPSSSQSNTVNGGLA